MAEVACRITVSACARCSGSGVVPVGVEDPRRCAVVKDASGQVVAALVGSSLVYQQCAQCLGTGGWTMDTHEIGKP